MNCSIFWGILLVLIGLSLIIKVVFNIDLPLIRIFIAFFLIFLGIRLFIGKNGHILRNQENASNVFFTERVITDVKNGSEYNFVFGKGVLDLRNITVPDSEDYTLKVNTVFGGSEILTGDSLNLRVRSNSAFGAVRMPDGTTVAFGSKTYTSDSLISKPVIRIEINTVFGGTVFKR